MDKQPISASERGDNAYYLGGCSFAEHNPPYAACLDKIKRVKAGDKTVPACCVEPIRNGSCQAVHMRHVEEQAGHAMYYVSREKLEQGIAHAPPWSAPPNKSAVTDRRGRNPKMDDLLAKTNGKPQYGAIALAGSYADAINAAAREEAEKAIGKEGVDLYTAIAEHPGFTKEGAQQAFAHLAHAPTPAPAPAEAPKSAPTKPALESPLARFRRATEKREGENQ